MRYLKSGLIALILLIGLSIPVAAQSGVRAVVVNDFSNIRLIPAIGADVLGTVPAGYEFDFVTARSSDGQWIRVLYLGYEGWVNLTPLTVLEGDVNALPVADPRSIPYGGNGSPRSGTSDAIGPVAARTTEGLRLRAGPSRAYATLLSIPANAGITLTGRLISNTWLQANYEGTLGWISANYVELLNGDINALPVDGVVASVPPPLGVTADDYIAQLRLMRDRLNLAQPSLDAIRASWTDAAVTGRAICQAYPPQPSDIVITIPLLAAYYDTLEPLRNDFNTAMFNLRYAIDLYIDVCNQPGTGNPVGQATVEGALGVVNLTAEQFQRLRDRLTELLPPDTIGAGQCLLEYNGQTEVLPVINPGTIYLDEFNERNYATGYCFDAVEGQIFNLQVLPIPGSNIAPFASVSPLNNPTEFVAVNRVTVEQRINLGPITINTSGRYVIIIADLGDDNRVGGPDGTFAVTITDIGFLPATPQLAFDPTTGSVIVTTEAQFTEGETFEGAPPGTTDGTGQGSIPSDFDTGPGDTGGVITGGEEVAGICPSTAFNCNQLFTCDEAQACLEAGNFSLDPDGNGIPCEDTLCGGGG